MENKVKVSVIIPTYNAEKTIQRAIDSILNQTFQDFEVIVVDDQSKDGTYQLLKEIAKNDSRVKIFQNKQNSKSAYTRNYAIKQSIGAYIMQLDDDDYCDINRIDKQYNFLKSNEKYDFVGSNVFLVDDNGIYGELKNKERPNKQDLIKTSPFFNPTVMFRREALEKVEGYRVSKETIRGQDYDLYLRMYVAGLKGYNIQENLVYYYKTENYFNKSSFNYRVGEFKFRYRNFKKLGLFPKALPYAIKPLLTTIIPNRVLLWNHKRKGIGRKLSS